MGLVLYLRIGVSRAVVQPHRVLISSSDVNFCNWWDIRTHLVQKGVNDHFLAEIVIIFFPNAPKVCHHVDKFKGINDSLPSFYCCV